MTKWAIRSVGRIMHFESFCSTSRNCLLTCPSSTSSTRSLTVNPIVPPFCLQTLLSTRQYLQHLHVPPHHRIMRRPTLPIRTVHARPSSDQYPRSLSPSPLSQRTQRRQTVFVHCVYVRAAISACQTATCIIVEPLLGQSPRISSTDCNTRDVIISATP
jgi:hypothetical protein